jgi:hypothetical protein
MIVLFNVSLADILNTSLFFDRKRGEYSLIKLPNGGKDKDQLPSRCLVVEEERWSK